MVKSFIDLAELSLSLGGHISFEWPRYCEGWAIKELWQFIARNNLHVADVDGCPMGMQTAKGEPILKQWRFVCSSQQQAVALGQIRCKHAKGFKHGVIAGGETKKTEIYPKPLCRTWLSSLFGYHETCPAMACGPKKQQGHREKEWVPVDFGASPMTTPVGFISDVLSSEEYSSLEVFLEKSQEEEAGGTAADAAALPVIPAMVTKLLDRSEMMSDPKARAAVRAEGEAIVDAGTWLQSTVMEKEDCWPGPGKLEQRFTLATL